MPLSERTLLMLYEALLLRHPNACLRLVQYVTRRVRALSIQEKIAMRVKPIVCCAREQSNNVTDGTSAVKAKRYENHLRVHGQVSRLS